jgi:hypothetical protein
LNVEHRGHPTTFAGEHGSEQIGTNDGLEGITGFDVAGFHGGHRRDSVNDETDGDRRYFHKNDPGGIGRLGSW